MTPDEFIEEQKKLWKDVQEKMVSKKDVDDIKAKLAQFEADRAAMKATVEGLETRLNRPAPQGKTEGEEKEAKYSKAFDRLCRKGDNVDEIKAMSTDDDTAGGYRVPVSVSNRLLESAQWISPVLTMATVETITVGDTIEIDVDTSEATVDNTTERGTRTDTGTPALGVESITAHEIYAMPKVTQKQLDDSGFALEPWLQRKLQRAFNKKLGTQLVTGTGVNQAKGFAMDTRYTHYASGIVDKVSLAGCRSQYFGLNPVYRSSASWLMNSTTMAYIYGLEDGVSRPLVQPDLTAGFGFRMMGRPIVDFVDLPDPSAGVFPIYFGDLAQAYTVLMRKAQTLLRDPYSSWPWVIFKVSWRVGGKTVFPEAMNRQCCEAS